MKRKMKRREWKCENKVQRRKWSKGDRSAWEAGAAVVRLDCLWE